eukprot:g5105.t1
MHHANVSPCALDIDVGYQEVISQSDRQQEQLVNAFWYSTPEQGHPVVLAASADPPCDGLASKCLPVFLIIHVNAISEAFSRAADAADNAQVVLIFPTLQEELKLSQQEQKVEKEKLAKVKEEEEAKKKEEEEHHRLKADWLNLLFTEQSVAAMSPEGPLPISLEGGNTSNPSALLVWIGDDPKAEAPSVKDWTLEAHCSKYSQVSVDVLRFVILSKQPQMIHHSVCTGRGVILIPFLRWTSCTAG